MLSSSKPRAISINFGSDNSANAKNRSQKFLQFQLGINATALLPAELVREIITVSESEILPVPQMPNCVMGIYSYRSEMLWIIDLENLLGYLSPLMETSDINTETRSLMTMILQFEDRVLGLVIPKVNDIVEYNLQEIYAPSIELFSDQMLPFVQGHFIDKKSEIIMLLKPEAIFSSLLLNINRVV